MISTAGRGVGIVTDFIDGRFPGVKQLSLSLFFSSGKVGKAANVVPGNLFWKKAALAITFPIAS